MQCLEPAFGAALANHPEAADGLAEALERSRAEIVDIEQAAEQASRAFGDDDPFGRGQLLQARGEVRRLADHRFLRGRPAADEIADDHGPGGDPDPRGQGARVRGMQTAHRLDRRKARPDRALGLVFVRPGPAKIGHDPVTHELGDMSFEAGDLVGHRVLVGVDDLAHLLGVEPRAERRRAHEVDEHHRELAPFGPQPCRRRGLDIRESRRGGLGNRSAQRGDGSQQALPVPQRQAEYGKIGVGQVV